MDIYPLLVPLIAAVWVFFDARAIGVRKGQLRGLLDAGPGHWAFGVFFFLIVMLPLYLLQRGRYKQINADLKAQALARQMAQEGAASDDGSVWPPPPQRPLPPVWPAFSLFRLPLDKLSPPVLP